MAERVLGPTGSTRRRRFLLVPILLICSALFYVAGGQALPPGSTGSPNDSGLFQLDANTLPTTCQSPFPGATTTSGDDWAALYTQSNPPTADPTPCGSDGFVFVPDGTGNADHSYWSQGGSKDAYDPALGPWLWKPTDVAPDKTDLPNAFASMYHLNTAKYLYFGSDRFDASGDAQQGFQFLQSAVCLKGPVLGTDANGLPCPASTPSTPTGCTPAFTNPAGNAGYFVDPATGCPVHHRNGDLLILVNFNNGGTIGLAAVYEWWGANGSGAGCYGTPPNGPTPGQCDQPVIFGTGADCTAITGANDFCSTSNKVVLANEPIWAYTNKDGGHSYATSAFVEGGVNLAHIPGAGQCFPSFLAESRSSAGPNSGLSLQAQLKDLAMGRFQLCQPAITIRPNAVNEVGATHTFTVKVTNNASGQETPIQGAHPTVTFPTGGNLVTNLVDTCADDPNNPNDGTNANGECTVSFTSNTAGDVTAHATVTVTIEGTQFTVSTDGHQPNSGPATKRFVDANVSIAPNGVNAVGGTHTFTVTSVADPQETTPTISSITPSVSPSTPLLNNTCGSPTQNGNTATCSFQISSSSAATFTANATAVWSFADSDPNANPATATVTRSTSGNSGPDGSGPATKRFVDANVSIAPNGVNEVGHAHTFTITSVADPQGTTPTITSLTPSVSPSTPLLNNTCGSPTQSGNTATCSFQINSSTHATFTADATAVWSFSGSGTPSSATVTRSTSGDSGPGGSGSVTKRFVDANISISPQFQVNEVNHEHVFTITSTAFPEGTTGTISSITPNLTTAVPAADYTESDTCGTPTQNGDTATCTVTINSTSAGVFTLNATAVWNFVDGDPNANPASVDVTRSTSGNSGPDGSGPAVKRYVDAYITIGPGEATNNVGQSHTFVISVFQDDGLAAGAPGGDNADGFGPAPDHTFVTVTLTNQNGANWQTTLNTCASPNGTTAGTCTVTGSSATAGDVIAHAAVTFTVGGVSLHRETDGTARNSGDAIKRFVAGSVSWTKVDNNNTPLGGATFRLCRTNDWDVLSNMMGPPLPQPICQTVTDNQAPDADPADGQFSVAGLPLGRYTAQETIAPPGWELDPTIQTVDLTPANTAVSFAAAFIDSRPIVKITGFAYTNAPDGLPQPSGIFKGTTTYTINLHNYGTATAHLTNSKLVVSGNASCPTVVDNTMFLSGTDIPAGGDSGPISLTCSYDHPNPAQIDATLTVKYTTNTVERTASGSPATISFTVDPN
jgi:hypothetical protein